MNYTEARQGRVWVMRLENGDVLHESIETLAEREHVQAAVCFALGGADVTSRIVAGPDDGRAAHIVPQVVELQDVYETAAVGTVFPDETGVPKLHMHAVFGRGDDTLAGCVRPGVKTWLVGEIVVLELVDCSARRCCDRRSGLSLLQIQ